MSALGYIIVLAVVANSVKPFSTQLIVAFIGGIISMIFKPIQNLPYIVLIAVLVTILWVRCNYQTTIGLIDVFVFLGVIGTICFSSNSSSI